MYQLSKRFRVDPFVARLLAGIVLVLVLMSVLRPGVFLSWNNVRSMSFQFPEFAILSLAVMLTMLTGGIDLSIVSNALLSATLGILTISQLQPPTADSEQILTAVTVGVVAALSTGLMCGLANGFLITRVQISPILATLGTMQLYGGFALVLTEGTSLYGFPDGFVSLGNSTIFGFPVPLFIFLVCATSVAFLLNRSRLGYRIYLLGNNPTAARFAGIDSTKVISKTYAMSGLLSAVAGLIMVARTNSVNADYGSSYLLLAILVSVLGGVHPAGGFGRVSGLVLAVLLLQFLSSGLNMLRFSSFTRDIFWGGLLLLVMVLNRRNQSRKLVEP